MTFSDLDSSSTALVTIIVRDQTEAQVPGERGCHCGQKKNMIKVRIFVELKFKSKPKTHQATIIGGQFAEVNEFPWAAYLSLRSTETGDTGWCGGSLVSDRHVLTAAHCLQQDTPSGDIEFLYDDITVTLGSKMLTKPEQIRFIFA